MPQSSIAKAGILAVVLVAIGFAGWEIYLRSQGLGIAYDDGPEMWSEKRQQVYLPMDEATVFVGSSRHKFDLDIDTWKSITGEDALQLAEEGSNPLPLIDDLANDPDFKGKLVIDVTEGLFFSLAPPAFKSPYADLEYYKSRTPAQRAGYYVNRALESQFLFLDKQSFSLNAMLHDRLTQNRKGVFALPCEFPAEFNRVTADRQCVMTDKFAQDTSLRNYVKGIWQYYGSLDRMGPLKGPKLDSIFNSVQTAITKIKSRGGKVIFVRTPSSGPFRKIESEGYPREAYWDRLLSSTGCPGIHFEDYPAISGFDCPEFSHLRKSDAVIYTENLVKIIESKGWSFPKKQVATL